MSRVAAVSVQKPKPSEALARAPIFVKEMSIESMNTSGIAHFFAKEQSWPSLKDCFENTTIGTKRKSTLGKMRAKQSTVHPSRIWPLSR